MLAALGEGDFPDDGKLLVSPRTCPLPLNGTTPFVLSATEQITVFPGPKLTATNTKPKAVFHNKISHSNSDRPSSVARTQNIKDKKRALIYHTMTCSIAFLSWDEAFRILSHVQGEPPGCDLHINSSRTPRPRFPIGRCSPRA